MTTNKLAPHVLQATRPRSRAVIQTPELPTVELAGMKVGFDLSAIGPNIAQTVGTWYGVIGSGLTNEAGALSGHEHAAEILTISVPQHARVPWTSGDSQLPAHEPAGRLDEDIVFHFPQQPLERCQI